MLWLMKLKRFHLSLPCPRVPSQPNWHAVWPNMRVQMECLFLWPCHPPCLTPTSLGNNLLGKKTLLIWLDNLFSHINSGPTGANEKCVINVRRLNASRMCSSVSLRRGPDNYYPAALKDMRAQFSHISYMVYTGLIAFPSRICRVFRRVFGCHLTKVLNLSGLGRDT